MWVYTRVFELAFSSPPYEYAEWNGWTVWTVTGGVLRSLRTVLRGAAPFTLRPRVHKGSLSPMSHQHLLFLGFSMWAVRTVCGAISSQCWPAFPWGRVTPSILSWLSTIWMSSLKECLFRPFAHFWVGLLVGFCYWVTWVYTHTHAHTHVFWILIPY